MSKKIYIAGWDVFKPNSKEIGEQLKDICKKYGFEGLYPLDNVVNTSNEIYNGNIKLIKESDYVIANMNAFRGYEPDSGTSFEVGYAIGMGKTVIAYLSEVRPMKEWVKDDIGCFIEDFGYPLNLMIAESCHIINGDAEDAIKYIKEFENKGKV